MMADMLRRLPIFKGKQRLARMLLGHQINSGKDLVVHGRDNCRYLLPNVKEIIGFEILINGIFEPEVIHFLTNSITPGSVFIDLGANIGAISLPVGKARPDIQLAAVEAAPWIVNYLRKNVEMNGLRNVEVVSNAITRQSDERVDFYAPEILFGKGSLAPIFTSTPEKVSSLSLDDLAARFEQKPIGMIKADVEGFEADAFRGGEKLLSSSNAPDILFEFVDWAEEASGSSPGSAQQVLLDFGYKLNRFVGGKVGDRIVEPVAGGCLMIFASKN